MGSKLKRINTVVISTQHDENVSLKTVKDYVIEECIKKVIPADLLESTEYIVNPTGRFVIGGPLGDAGLTGRIIVDTYGSHGAHEDARFLVKIRQKSTGLGLHGEYIAKI